MKKILFLIPFFLMAGCLSATAQSATLRDSLVGLWQYQESVGEEDAGDSLKTTFHFKADSTLRVKALIETEELEGALRISVGGTWSAQGDSVTLNMLPENVRLEYFGENAELRELFASMGAAAGKKNRPAQRKVARVLSVTEDTLTFLGKPSGLSLGEAVGEEEAGESLAPITFRRLLLK